MASKTAKKIAASLFLLVAIIIAVFFSARWFLNSGRLKAWVEKTAGEATSSNVQIKSLSLAWPLRVEIEDLVISAPGHDATPVLTCPRITVASAIGRIIRGHADTVVLISPKIHMFTVGQGGTNIPDIELGGGSFSAGSIKIIDAEIELDSPELKVNSRGILATFSSKLEPAGAVNVVKLDVDAVDASVNRDKEEPIPLSVRLLQSKFVQREKLSGLEIEGEIHAGLSTEVPQLSLPDNIPILATFEFDYFPERDSLENGIFNISALTSTKVRVYGSVQGLTSGAPSSNLKVTVSPLDLEGVYEYVELMKRPNYEDIKLSGKVRLGADIAGDLRSPEISISAAAKRGRIEWQGFAMEGFEVEAPLAIENGAMAIRPGRVSADRAVIPVGQKNVRITSLSGIVSGDGSKISMDDATAIIGEVGEISYQGTFDRSSGLMIGSARMADVSLEKALAFAAPVIGDLPDDVSVSGLLDLDLDVERRPREGRKPFGGKYRVTLKGMEVTSGELFAAAGIDGKLEGSVRTALAEEPSEFAGNGYVEDFELLYDVFYKDFSDNRFPFSFDGEYAPKSKRLQKAGASMDLGPIGKITADGSRSFSGKSAGNCCPCSCRTCRIWMTPSLAASLRASSTSPFKESG
jgi:hypothetical protein